MKLDRRKRLMILNALIAVLVICLAATVVFLYRKLHRGTPLKWKGVLSSTIAFDADQNIAAEIQDNYMAYLNRAYVLIGNYPDCQYVKISANVTRNDYDWEKDFYVGDGQLYKNYYRDGKAAGKVGIDVSEHQGTVDWEKVKAAGIEIAMIRVGYRGYGQEGKMVEDTMYRTNLEGAAGAGLSCGVYFFSEAVNREEGVEEANFVLDRIKGENVTRQVVIDTEYIYDDTSARANDISNADRTAAIVGFCETVKAAGYQPMIYASRDWFLLHMNIDDIGGYQFWLAAYDTPVFPYHTEGYQYSPYGYADGITENQVDLDVFMDP